MISDIHVLFSNNKSKVQSHTHNFFLSLARFPWPKLVHEVDFGEGQFFDAIIWFSKVKIYFWYIKMIWHGGMTCFFFSFVYFLRIWLNFLKIKIWGIICQEILLIYYFFCKQFCIRKKTQSWTKTIPTSLPRTQNNQSDITLTNKCYVKEL